MELQPMAPSDLAELRPFRLDERTPLWFYILKEAKIEANGARLGPVGGRIVAEVFIGLLQGDHNSFLRQDPEWKPTLTDNGEFKVVDLLRVAGVVGAVN
jgi:hypothetical protein